MRLISCLILTVAILLAVTSCKEVNPGITFVVPEKPLLDTNYMVSVIPAAEDHEVLLFDVTGVACNNCPKAAALARKLADTLYPGKVVVVALYPNTPSLFSLVHPWAGFDTMSNDDAEAIVQYNGGAPQLPIGCVDQIQLSGSRFINYPQWSSNVVNRMAIGSPVNIDINSTWDASKNRGRVNAKITCTQNVSGKHVVFICLTESKVIGKQLDQDIKPSGYTETYSHNHALRKLYTAKTGDTLKADFTQGRVFEREFFVNPRYNWKPENMDVVVWVVDATTKEVIQAGHGKLKP